MVRHIREQYRCASGEALNYEVFLPMHPAAKPMTGLILFFGGGWYTGTPAAMEPQARIIAEAGYCVITPDYRVYDRHGTDPHACAKDAACFWTHIRDAASGYDADPERLYLGGSSAGAHIALLAGWQGHQPRGYVLYNPAIMDYSSEGFKRFYREFRTLDPNAAAQTQTDDFFAGLDIMQYPLPSKVPPMLILHGEQDELVPLADVRQFAGKLQKNGGNVKLIVYGGAKHGFWLKERSEVFFHATCEEILRFLQRQETKQH